jgi:hypothetical protein
MPKAALLAALLAALALPLRAQEPDSLPAADASAATLEERMDAFLKAVDRGIERRAADFFPRDGHFTWVRTTHYPSGSHVGFWRFRASEVAKAVETCGPLMGSFEFLPHGQPVGGFYHQMMESDSTWRRVRGNRFVARSGMAKTPAFVEWRREAGRWVISSFGDEGYRADAGRKPMLGVPAWQVVRDTSAAHSRDDVYATGVRWQERNLPMITFDGYRYLRYGIPRPIESRELAWIARIGPVRVYAARGDRAGEVLYVPTDRGVYQPFQSERSPSCR